MEGNIAELGQFIGAVNLRMGIIMILFDMVFYQVRALFVNKHK